jgi:uncharacterized damage-inducible protein DinB
MIVQVRFMTSSPIGPKGNWRNHSRLRAAIEAFRQQTASATRSYLDRSSGAELNSPREMISDPDHTRLFRPADVIMRVVTHIFNHQGQVLAMCRTIGKPNHTHDLDYPMD